MQLSLVAIYTCLKKAYEKSKVSEENLMFKYWLNFQVDYLFCNSLSFFKSLVKWFFIFDQYNYSRWISVHLEDLLTLPVACPKLYEQFLADNFVAQNTSRQFSRIHFDYVHEQCNKVIKCCVTGLQVHPLIILTMYMSNVIK